MGVFLRLSQVSKSYQSGPKRLRVLRQFDLDLEPGELLAVVGRSGSGKTTLLNVIGGLDKPDEGHIYLDDKDLTNMNDAGWDRVRQREIGFIFQFNQLLPEFNALENIMLPGMLANGDLAALEEKARALLKRMDMISRAHHLPAQLSGGEQQRVAIARALINSPRLILADEPTGNLDRESARTVFDLLSGLRREFGLACILVTHNPGLAGLCDRIRTLEGQRVG